ncbi:3-hydroxyacyl-CoA dehydrogenase [Companilactobacillus sp. HBUAS59699]|uniref:3-hydroxyacyl-CoA dehydrogenase n=1 Tax=Companilactobacillus sp. HBUAS59699 TaxID=3109358 RepID=UPI002FF24BA6
MSIKNVTIAGSGVLGSQIAFQTAFRGYNVTIYDINDDVIAKAKDRIRGLVDTYKNEVKGQSDHLSVFLRNGVYESTILPNLKDTLIRDLTTSRKNAEAVPASIKYSSNLADAVKNADLVIEAIPERLDIKESYYKQLSEVANEKTIFATNTSTLLPSQFAEITGRPKKFLALHFANEIWKNNTAEIMGTKWTDPEVYDTVVDFAKGIGMIPIKLKKEQPGYVLNTLLVPLLDAAQMLLAKGIADIETVDKTWMLATKAPLGPFGILDVVGLKTAYDITASAAETDPEYKQLADMIKNDYIDKGKMGVATGEGFYKYPNPEYAHPDFLE